MEGVCGGYVENNAAQLGEENKAGRQFFLWAAQIRLTGIIPRQKQTLWRKERNSVIEREREREIEREREGDRQTEPTTGDKFCILKAKDTKIE